MPYLGNPAQQRFSSPRAASVYSGDGSTVAFTLEEAVTTDEDILVSVDGVIQEPSVAYAVSSGTTLTFTAAPSSNSGNNIFVYYIARTFGSVSMPDGQNVNAAVGSFSGTLTTSGAFTSLGIDDNADATAITITSDENVGIGLTAPQELLHIKDGSIAVGNGTASNNARVGKIGFSTDSSNSRFIGMECFRGSDAANADLRFHTYGGDSDNGERLRISNVGHVTISKQPSFLARPSSTQNNFAVGSEVVVVFGTEVFDRGANFSSSTFTAPIEGLYQFNASLRIEGVDSASSYYYIDIRTSNRDYQFIFDPDFGQDNAYFTMVVSCLADMDAGDTADVAILQGSGTQQTDIMVQSHFTGHLVC